MKSVSFHSRTPRVLSSSDSDGSSGEVEDSELDESEESDQSKGDLEMLAGTGREDVLDPGDDGGKRYHTLRSGRKVPLKE